MIYVKRLKCPKSLDGKKSGGGIETENAILAISNGTDFEFTAYKGSDVVTTLRNMFNKKCAYCEFNYAAGGPEDIEHYRPKGAVIINGKLSYPGYYWLAATWENLLPSCQDCNRRRTKEFAVGLEISGKGNYFPLDDESKRRRTSRSRTIEVPLLLNPCDDRPDSYLEFIPNGLVRERGKSRLKILRGRTTIDIFGLDRGDLVDARRTREMFVTVAVENALEAIEEAKKASSIRSKREKEAKATRLLSCARMYLDPAEPYLAVARAVFKRYGLKP